MCLGEIDLLAETWDDGGVPAGRLERGGVVTLAFVPEAEPGSRVLIHLGVPVAVLDTEAAAEALALRHSTGGEQ
jgi:hydrogenase maturation factor